MEDYELKPSRQPPRLEKAHVGTDAGSRQMGGQPPLFRPQAANMVPPGFWLLCAERLRDPGSARGAVRDYEGVTGGAQTNTIYRGPAPGGREAGEGKPLKSAELSAEQNYNMIDGVMNNTPPAPVLPEEIAGLQQDYAELWGCMNDILKQLTAIVEK